MTKFPPISVHNLGDYLREQRHSAELSLRQLSEVAGISNPYLSQIERGLKKPSAEILAALAKALRISAESLYVRAGFLEEHTGPGAPAHVDVQAAVLADPALSNRQRAVLLDVYESFVGKQAPSKAPRAPRSAKAANATNATIANTTKAAEATRPIRPTKPRPAKTPAHHSPDPAVNTTKEN